MPTLRDESGQTFAELAFAGLVVAIVAVIVVVVVATTRSHHSGPSAFQRANTVCGDKAKPVRIVQHVREFPEDNWLEVHCNDGTMRAVKGG